MRWSIVRLIWARELRDQLRDRRTVFMVTVLPLLLYPALGLGVLPLAVGLTRGPSVVGVVGAHRLPQQSARSAGTSPLPVVASVLALPPADPSAPGCGAD